MIFEVLKELHERDPEFEDVNGVVRKCSTCRKAKRFFHKESYTPLPAPERPWEDMSLGFHPRLTKNTMGQKLYHGSCG